MTHISIILFFEGDHGEEEEEDEGEEEAEKDHEHINIGRVGTRMTECVHGRKDRRGP